MMPHNSTITTNSDGITITNPLDGKWYITYPKKSDRTISTYYFDCRILITNTNDGSGILKNAAGTIAEKLHHQRSRHHKHHYANCRYFLYASYI
jgi:hypothetical protein